MTGKSHQVATLPLPYLCVVPKEHIIHDLSGLAKIWHIMTINTNNRKSIIVVTMMDKSHQVVVQGLNVNKCHCHTVMKLYLSENHNACVSGMADRKFIMKGMFWFSFISYCHSSTFAIQSMYVLCTINKLGYMLGHVLLFMFSSIALLLITMISSNLFLTL